MLPLAIIYLYHVIFLVIASLSFLIYSLDSKDHGEMFQTFPHTFQRGNQEDGSTLTKQFHRRLGRSAGEEAHTWPGLRIDSHTHYKAHSGHHESGSPSSVRLQSPYLISSFPLLFSLPSNFKA
jgi:hypothetical protein